MIEPLEDLSGMKKIGEEITEELDMVPGHFFVRQFVRPKYARLAAKENKPSVVIGQLPSHIIDKGIAGPCLLAQLIFAHRRSTCGHDLFVAGHLQGSSS